MMAIVEIAKAEVVEESVGAKRSITRNRWRLCLAVVARAQIEYLLVMHAIVREMPMMMMIVAILIVAMMLRMTVVKRAVGR